MEVVVVTVIVVVVVAVFAGSVLLGLRLRRRWFAGTGREQWQSAARDLTWRQHASIVLAQSRGRPVTDPSLAEASLLRGRYVVAAGDRMLAPKSPWRRLRWLLVGIAALNAGLGVLALLDDDHGRGLFMVTLWTLNGGLWLAFPWMQSRGLRQIQRSMDGTKTGSVSGA